MINFNNEWNRPFRKNLFVSVNVQVDMECIVINESEKQIETKRLFVLTKDDILYKTLFDEFSVQIKQEFHQFLKEIHVDWKMSFLNFKQIHYFREKMLFECLKTLKLEMNEKILEIVVKDNRVPYSHYKKDYFRCINKLSRTFEFTGRNSDLKNEAIEMLRSEMQSEKGDFLSYYEFAGSNYVGGEFHDCTVANWMGYFYVVYGIYNDMRMEKITGVKKVEIPKNTLPLGIHFFM